MRQGIYYTRKISQEPALKRPEPRGFCSSARYISLPCATYRYRAFQVFGVFLGGYGCCRHIFSLGPMSNYRYFTFLFFIFFIGGVTCSLALRLLLSGDGKAGGDPYSWEASTIHTGRHTGMSGGARSLVDRSTQRVHNYRNFLDERPRPV